MTLVVTNPLAQEEEPTRVVTSALAREDLRLFP
jgi:hypothetical protein